jgi:hypothetical protein
MAPCLKDIESTISGKSNPTSDSLSVFSDYPCDDSPNSSVSDSDKNSDSKDSDSSDSDGDCPFEDEVDYPPEYYLIEAENLDVS